MLPPRPLFLPAQRPADVLPDQLARMVGAGGKGACDARGSWCVTEGDCQVAQPPGVFDPSNRAALGSAEEFGLFPTEQVQQGWGIESATG